jgi:hypothetical protein
MPAFGKVENPDHIWDMVNYVRTLQSNVPAESVTRGPDLSRRGRELAQVRGLARR